ncbi:hypothetical protein Taro_043263, partial [Colocasia esculenta]|nr:hypothetical protein [Colocasia esculenta]
LWHQATLKLIQKSSQFKKKKQQQQHKLKFPWKVCMLKEKGSETQGEGNENPPENQFREGETASSSDSEDDQDQQPQMDKAQKKGKAAEVPDVPLLADTPYQRQMRQRVIINLKPIIERLDAHGEILCSLQSDVNSIFMSQASTSKELAIRAAAASPQAEVRGSGPDEQVSGPLGQAEVSGSGPVEKVSRPSRPLESESVQHIAEEAEAVASEPPAPSSTQTPAIDALGSADAHTEAIQVDFATLQVPEEILLPPIHSLVMDSSVGSIIFERFARVMGRIKVQKGFQVAFHTFLFREYHQGHVSAEVLAPILSE